MYTWSNQSNKRKLGRTDGNELDLPFTARLNDNDEVIVTAEGTNCPVTKVYLEKHQSTEKQQRNINLKSTAILVAKSLKQEIGKWEKSTQSIYDYLIPAIISEITNQYEFLWITRYCLKQVLWLYYLGLYKS